MKTLCHSHIKHILIATLVFHASDVYTCTVLEKASPFTACARFLRKIFTNLCAIRPSFEFSVLQVRRSTAQFHTTLHITYVAFSLHSTI